MENNKKQILRTFEDSLGTQHFMSIEFSVAMTEQYGPTWVIDVLVDGQSSYQLMFSGTEDIRTLYSLLGCIGENSRNNTNSEQYIITVPRGVRIKSLHYEIEEEKQVPVESCRVVTTPTQETEEEVKTSETEIPNNGIADAVLEASIEDERQETVQVHDIEEPEHEAQPNDGFIYGSHADEEEAVNLDELTNVIDDVLESYSSDRIDYTKLEPLSDGEIRSILITNSMEVYHPEDLDKYENLISTILDYSKKYNTNVFSRKDMRNLIDIPSHITRPGMYATRVLSWLIRHGFATEETISQRAYTYTIDKTFYEIFTKN